MTTRRLAMRAVARTWGRRDLPPPFPCGDGGEPIGEIWFEGPPEAELLAKYLFTHERLSIQVHPDDAAARAAGHARGKDEAWYVLDAAPGAAIGLGLTRRISSAQLRQAALDGSIEALLNWRRVRAGEVFYSPAGTIHAIGGGVSLIEIQQNLDLTYRLYDYGRPRELHVDAAIAVAEPAPWNAAAIPVQAAPGRSILATGGAFVLERWTRGRTAALPLGTLLLPLGSRGSIDGAPLEGGSVWSAEGTTAIEGAVDLLVAYPGGVPLELGA
jgi:mannose-6-phosphate isomerase